MEEITKRDGIFYYGERRCEGPDDAYHRFRNDYNASVGRAAFLRLDRLGQRTERIHGFGFHFAEGYRPEGGRYTGYGKVRYRMGGIVCLSYARILGLEEYGHIPDEEFDGWLEWAFTRGSGALKLVGREKGSGRKSKRLKTRYR